MLSTFTKSLLCLLFISYSLAHDHLETPFEPTFEDFDEQFLTPRGRSLADTTTEYPNMRIATDFELLTAGTDEFKTYIKTQLVPAIVDYLQAALKIKYPLTGVIQSNAKSLCGFPTPAAIKNGIENADMVIFFNSKQASGYSWMAATTLCSLSTGTKRPLIVNIGINSALIKTAEVNRNPLTHDLYINVMTHEFIHALGMNGPLYNYFVDETGTPLTGHVKKSTLGGIERTVLDLPVFTERLRAFYGCPIVPGLFMETGGAHVHRRFFQWDIMATGSTTGSKISEITLGFLEGTGWYVPDYSYAEPYFFGRGQGCSFFDEDISARNFPEYCTGTSVGCTQINNGGGYCVGDSLIGVGRVYTAQIEFNCENPNGVYYTPFSSKQVYGRGKGSRCFSGNLTTYNTQVSNDTYCLNATCVGSGINATINFMWGKAQYNCTSEGMITIPGYKGIFNCPDPVAFCSTVGIPTCPRNCMGRGVCNEGQCTCKDGFEGTDCGFAVIVANMTIAE